MDSDRRVPSDDAAALEPTSTPESTTGTTGQEYTERLESLATRRWKVVLDTQRPYRWNLRRLQPGRTLDIGCGIGRNLANLSEDSVGVDHNPTSIDVVRSLGLTGHLADDFPTTHDALAGSFDSLLFSHVVEHVDASGARSLLEAYIPYLKPAGKIIIVCPQERGYASDSTHVLFNDFEVLASLLDDVGFDVLKSFSFPFPRFVGKLFTYNEFVVVATRLQAPRT